jgi:hypothetical protein
MGRHAAILLLAASGLRSGGNGSAQGSLVTWIELIT